MACSATVIVIVIREMIDVLTEFKLTLTAYKPVWRSLWDAAFSSTVAKFHKHTLTAFNTVIQAKTWNKNAPPQLLLFNISSASKSFLME